MLEVNGEQDSLRFNLERKNELQVFGMGAQPRAKQGIQEIPAPKATYHPFSSNLWREGQQVLTVRVGSFSEDKRIR